MLGRLLELVNEWEIQLLVLLSFILQLFLFFTGSLRRRSRNWFLRGTIWIAYLGADVVAIYALGLLSRHAMDNHNDDASSSSSSIRLAHPLAFLWAPFLLIHLGGQDTITAFAIEDNNLWLRHLLNLLLQVTLALYVFWKSSSWSSAQVLVPGILVFVAGIIKYGERTAALRHGNLNNMVVIPKESTTTTNNTADDDPLFGSGIGDDTNVTSTSIIYGALWSSTGIRMLFASHKTLQLDIRLWEVVHSYRSLSKHRALFKLMDVELGMMYNDLYTKAAVLRTKSGIVFRCISLTSSIAALTLFFFLSTSSRADHHGTTTNTGCRVDTAITYTLFIGGLVVDICTLLTTLLASPWTWAWLRARGHSRIARISLCLLSCDMVSGWLGTTRPLWSNTMGQYRFVCYDNDLADPWSPPPATLSERMMGIIRKQVGTEREKKLFWLSKLLETKDVAVDENVKLCLVKAVDDIAYGHQEQQWPCLGKLLLEATRPGLTNDFVHFISSLHACTEVLLGEAAAAAAAATRGIITTPASASAAICRKLSGYMMYLVAAHPAGASLLQVFSGNPEVEFQNWKRRYSQHSSLEMRVMRRHALLEDNERSGGILSWALMTSVLPPPEMWQQTLEELKHMWARLLVYAAAKSRPEGHAAELARGGELLTFVWLLLSHNGIGVSSTSPRVDLVRDEPQPDDDTILQPDTIPFRRTVYAFNNLRVQMPPQFPPPPLAFDNLPVVYPPQVPLPSSEQLHFNNTGRIPFPGYGGPYNIY